MKDKCSYADKYKALYPPKCGCRACRDKFVAASIRDSMERHKDLLDRLSTK